jgi:hypothetical protein
VRVWVARPVVVAAIDILNGTPIWTVSSIRTVPALPWKRDGCVWCPCSWCAVLCHQDRLVRVLLTLLGLGLGRILRLLFLTQDRC